MLKIIHRIIETKMDDAFDIHLPIYPLPNEILKMEHAETICKYCGISYLIHSEVKKLKEKIQVQFDFAFEVILK